MNMIELDPTKRKTAERYLQEQCGKIFPKSFYSFLYDYMRILTQPQWGPSDPKIDKYSHYNELKAIAINLKIIFYKGCIGICRS